MSAMVSKNSLSEAYLTYYASNKKRVVSLDTQSLQIAKEKKRQFESAQARGGPSFLPTRTPISALAGMAKPSTSGTAGKTRARSLVKTRTR